MTTSFPPINYPNKPVPPFSAPAPRNPFPGFFPDMWKNITGKPYITVSSKGLANGLSEYFNDGADFGPDSLQADGTLTQTAGILEAWNYAVSIGEYNLEAGGLLIPKIQMEEGVFVITGNATLTAPQVVLDIKIEGISQGGTWIQLNFNSGYAFTIDPSIVSGTNLDIFSYATVFNGSGYTAEGLLSIVIPSTDSNYQTSVVQTYSLDVSGGNTVYNLSGFQMVSLTNPGLYGKSTFSISNCMAVNIVGGTNGAGNNLIYIDNCQFVSISAFNGRATIIQLNGSSGLNMDAIFVGSSFYLQVANEIHKISLIGTQLGEAPYGVIDPSYRIGLITGYSSATIENLYVLGDINDTGSDVAYLESGITITNIITQFIDARFTGIPYSVPTLSTNSPVSGTVYQNTNPYNIEIDLPVYATTSGTAGYVTIAKGSTDTPTAIGNQYVSGDTSSTSTQIIKVRVPAGWYYSFTGSGVTFATATPFAE